MKPSSGFGIWVSAIVTEAPFDQSFTEPDHSELIGILENEELPKFSILPEDIVQPSSQVQVKGNIEFVFPETKVPESQVPIKGKMKLIFD